MRIPYAAPSYGQAELDAVARALSDPAHLVAGPAIREVETVVASVFGHDPGVMVNSGTSANLLALAALDLPRGTRVITPACTIGSVVAPIVQLGLTPEFVDVEPGTYNVSAEAVEAATYRHRNAVLLIPLLVGNLPDMQAIRRIADARGCYLIADSCDQLGPIGTLADAVTTSFYATHMVTAAGTGGLVSFADREHTKRARLLAYWGRASIEFGESDDVEKRFGAEFGGVPYDAKFGFSLAGYNMQPMELQAAFLLKQLRNLPAVAFRRRANFGMLMHLFRAYEEHFILPSTPGDQNANWLAFPLTVRESAPFTRMDMARHLEASGIQTRPVMAGNILRHPGFRDLGNAGDFPGANRIMRGGIMVGCHQGMGAEEVGYIGQVVREFMADG